MGLEVLPDQRQVVIAAGSLDFGASLTQPIQIAIGGEVFPNQAASFLVIRFLNQNLHHAVQGSRQLLQLLALPRMDLLQLFLGAFVDRRYSSDEHLGQVIPSSHSHSIDQGQHQCVAFRQRTVLQLGDVRRSSLGSKVADLGIDDPVKNGFQVPKAL